jgi:hypothetical protein
LTFPDENVRREIGPECSFDAAVIAESVAGDRVDPSVVGSATTRVDCKRKSPQTAVLRSEVLTGETAERRRDSIMVEEFG